MRFTLDPVGDVEVPDGTTVREARAGLVALTGIAALGTAPLRIAGRRLDDGQVAGAEPWVPGCVLRVGAPRGPVTPDPAREATHAAWHVAVVAGPDAGLVAVPGPDGSVEIGRRPGPVAPGEHEPAGRLVLTDDAVSVRHAVVRRTARGWRVRDAGSVNGTRVVDARAGRRRRWARARARRDAGRAVWSRPVRRARGRRVGPGTEVLLGSTVLVLRRVAWEDEEAPETRASPPPRLPVATWVVPLLASVALAAALRSPIPLLFGLSALAPALTGLRGRRTTAPPAPALRWPDPAASAIRAAARGDERVVPVPEPRRSRRRSGAPEADGGWPQLRGAVALVGPRRRTVPLARTLVGAAIAEPEVSLRFALGTGHEHEWAWCRWLEARGASATHAGPASAGAPSGRSEQDAPGPRVLLVADGADRTTTDQWSLARTVSTGAVVLVRTHDDVPAWCAWIVEGDGRARRNGAAATSHDPRGRQDRQGEQGQQGGPDGGVCEPARVVPTGPVWAETQARRAAARDHARRQAGSGLPDRLGLLELGVAADPTTVAEAWDTRTGALGTLAARIAVDADGPTSLDLLGDGPHALVAGTTGAGKSALLQSWLLDLALRHPPEQLVMVLVDFKGGAGLGPCRGLPHVVGEVTDLDAALAARALDGVRRELRRREQLLREAGVGDLEALRARGPAPPRILVVVDELRALRDDLPDVLPALIRLAAQGRSLGIHLVLATQRPAGAVDAQVRANVGLRICLRVTDPAESLDVVDVPDAAQIPSDRPGRAVIRRGHAAPAAEQTAWAGLCPAASTARWARPWPAAASLDREAAPGRPPNAVDPTAPAPALAPPDPLVGLVAAAQHAAVGRPAPRRLWSPPLPSLVTDEDLSARAHAVDSEAAGREPLPFGLLDLPDRVEHTVAGWRPQDGALLVVGRPGSGRSTALAAIARAGARAQLRVHHVRGRPAAATAAPATAPAAGTASAAGTAPEAGTVPAARAVPAAGTPGAGLPETCLGTVVDVQDPRRLVRLLHLLRETATHREVRHLVVVDDVGGVLRVLDALPHGAGAELLVDLLRDAARLGIGLAAAGNPGDLLRLVPHAGARLVLATADPHDDDLLGVPRNGPARRVPGRGVLLPEGALVQVSGGPGEHAPDPVPTSSTVACARHANGVGGRTTARTGRGEALRLAPLPRDVVLGSEPPWHGTAQAGPAGGRSGASAGRSVPLGRGGDAAEEVLVPLSRGVLVVGPPGSGRSTTLRTLRAGLAPEAAVRTLAAVAGTRSTGTGPTGTGPTGADGAGEPAGSDVPGRVGGAAGTADARTSSGVVLGELRAWARTAPSREQVLVVDDLDLVLASYPDLDELLATWVEEAGRGGGAPLVLASISTERAAVSFHGVVASLRRLAPVVVLSPSSPGSVEACGARAATVWAAADPVLAHHPGRAALVHRGTAIPLQVARHPDVATATATATDLR